METEGRLRQCRKSSLPRSPPRSAALVLAAAGAAATITVSIKSTGFSPSSITVNHGDKVIFRNVDKVDHQVVADDGSFASPILHANQSWTTARARTRPGLPLPRRALPAAHRQGHGEGPAAGRHARALDPDRQLRHADHALGRGVLDGRRTSRSSSTQQPWGQASLTQLAIVKTGSGGTYSFTVTPSIYTTYVARWKTVASEHRRRAGRAEDPADPGGQAAT